VGLGGHFQIFEGEEIKGGKRRTGARVGNEAYRMLGCDRMIEVSKGTKDRGPGAYLIYVAMR